jgi:hypothetical protein
MDDDLNAATIRAAERERDDLRAAFAAVLSFPEGKRVLFWVLEQAAIYRDAYSGDDGATNYTLGQQSVGRKLIGMLDDIDPRTYPRLLLDIADMKAMERAAVAQDDQEDDEDA